MARTILGQRIDPFTIHRVAAGVALAGLAAGADPSAPPKSDPHPALVGIDTDAEPLKVNFSLPAYDPATNNVLTGVTVVVVPQGQGEPDSPEGWMASSYPKATFDASALQAGGDFAVAIPDVPEGQFAGQVLLTYDA